MRPWLLAVALAACGGGKLETHAEAHEALMAAADEMIAVLNTVKDKESAEAAKPKLEALRRRMDDIQEQSRKLGAPENPQVAAKYQQSVIEAVSRIEEAMHGIPTDPEIRRILADVPGMGAR